MSGQKRRKKRRRYRADSENYGAIAEMRVDQALRSLTAKGKIHFGFRASNKLDSEGVDHVFGVLRPKLSVWIIQVSSGKRKRKTYYRRLSKIESIMVKKSYRRRRYYRYIPLLAVTPKIRDAQIEIKLLNIKGKYKSIFENKRVPDALKDTVVTFLADNGVCISPIYAGNTP